MTATSRHKLSVTSSTLATSTLSTSRRCLSLVLDGDIFEMPGGEMAQLAVGLEYRNDDIQSNPDAVARDGLFWGFFADKGAFGDVSIKEAFAKFSCHCVLIFLS